MCMFTLQINENLLNKYEALMHSPWVETALKLDKTSYPWGHFSGNGNVGCGEALNTWKNQLEDHVLCFSVCQHFKWLDRGEGSFYHGQTLMYTVNSSIKLVIHLQGQSLAVECLRAPIRSQSPASGQSQTHIVHVAKPASTLQMWMSLQRSSKF